MQSMGGNQQIKIKSISSKNQSIHPPTHSNRKNAVRSRRSCILLRLARAFCSIFLHRLSQHASTRWMLLSVDVCMCLCAWVLGGALGVSLLCVRSSSRGCGRRRCDNSGGSLRPVGSSVAIYRSGRRTNIHVGAGITENGTRAAAIARAHTRVGWTSEAGRYFPFFLSLPLSLSPSLARAERDG
jgi:hypothetical protein